MDKKLLIEVNICVVILLILGSLSNVVGYQSVKSTAMNESPLFTARTQRAINQRQTILASQYLGKEKGILLQFPTKDSKTVSLKKIIEIITNMSLKEFNYFMKKSNLDMNKEDSIELLYTLNKVNGSYIINNKDNPLQYTINEPWYPGCMLDFLKYIIIAFGLVLYYSLVLLILLIYNKINPTSLYTCSPGSFCAGTRCLNK